jgi:hypothetical protein
MPKGPRGEKRPGDVIGAAIMVAKIATGEIEERPSRGRAGGLIGGKAKLSALTRAERKALATKAARAR